MHDDTVDNLRQLRCEACRSDSPPVPAKRMAELLNQLPGWSIAGVDGIDQLVKTFKFHDFAAALDLANRIGELAEIADHHPRMVVEWGRLTVNWWTHTIGGLHLNDFILAARCEEVAKR